MANWLLAAPVRMALCCLAFSAFGCNNEGTPPPGGELYFPTAMAFAGEGANERLVVANANFDLQYRGGTVLSLDIPAIRIELEKCTEACTLDDLSPYLRGSVEIGSQASAMSISSDGDMAYVAVRADVNITSVRISDTGELSCSSEQPGAVCDSVHRRVDETLGLERDISFVQEPVSIRNFKDPSGLNEDLLVVGHRAGRVSLLRESDTTGDSPLLLDVLTDLPGGLSQGAFDARDSLFWIGQRSGRTITRVGVAGADLETDARLFQAQSVFVRGLNESNDIRDLRFDPDGDAAYVLLATPQALAIVEPMPDQNGGLEIRAIVPVGTGPSRVRVVDVPNGAQMERFLLVSCFGSREIYVIDPRNARILAVARGFSGPFEIATDSAGLVYVADFRASVLQVLSLESVSSCYAAGSENDGPCELRRVGTLGTTNIVNELL